MMKIWALAALLALTAGTPALAASHDGTWRSNEAKSDWSDVRWGIDKAPDGKSKAFL